MDITRQNFKEVLPIVEEAIKDATFIAIDTEFTGLCSERNLNAFDTPDERYNKLKETVHQFLLIQFGMCTFHYDSANKKYTNKAFNFYIFPRPFSRHAPDVKFMCQASSLYFLVSHGFDFTKLIRDGISYLNPQTAERLRESLVQKHTLEDQAFPSSSEEDVDGQRAKNSSVVIPDNHKEFIQKILDEVESLINSEDKEEINLEPCNAYLRRLIYESVQEKYRGLVMLHTEVDENDRYIVVTKGTADELKEKMKAKQEAELEELNEAVGFTKIIKMISESRKMVVGHNLMLDLLHICNNFVAPIPESYDEFKLMVKTLFPLILDTKFMASSAPFKERFLMKTGLGDLLKHFGSNSCENLNIESAKDFKGYQMASENEHEAGYDAFITGVCFIALCRDLASLQKDQRHKQAVLMPDSPLLQPYTNKLYMKKSNDIPYINLKGHDVVPNRDHVFHVSFPSEWKTTDISQLFYPVAGPVYISWINDTSAYVSLKKPERTSTVLKKLCGSSKTTTFKVTSYREYRRSILGSEKSNKRQPVESQSAQKRRRSDTDNSMEVSSSERQRSLSVEMTSVEDKADNNVEMESPGVDVPSHCRDSEASHPLFEEVDTWS